MKRRNLLQRIANNPKSARFDEIVLLLEAFGSHHIFIHPAISLPVNIQDVHGDAKPYQVRQFLKIVERFNLKLEE